ncbi:MAG: DUF3883 domain-containing protein [Acidobacteria bacterium]|nr:DUF3883 domain-containing protein [Acidobacteriota bacterium]
MSDAGDTRRTPRELIEYIRREEYGVGIDASEQEHRRLKSLRSKLDRTLTLLAEDLYSKQTHFVLELIQNADDNAYPNGVVPGLSFSLSPSRLVLVNNELGFRQTHVSALCDVGKSSKEKKKGYIGEKGIGFKSVFTVSDAPEIHSNGYHFRFNRTGEDKLLGYVVPEWCDPSEAVVPDATTIVLPAKRGREFSVATLENLDAGLLLFLSKVRELALHHDGSTKTFKRRDEAGFSHLVSAVVRPDGQAETEDTRFLRVSVAIPMNGAGDEKRPDIETSEVVLAFPVAPNGVANPQANSEVFAFLPIRPFGFKFSIQGDFILSSSREDIHTDRKWNRRLRDSIAKVFISAVDEFKKTDALAFSYLKFLPNDSEVVDPFFKPVISQVITLLSETKCLPSAGGDWKIPRELRFGNRRFQELYPPLTAQKLFGFDYVDSRVVADEDILRRLGAKRITDGDFVNVFKLHGDWLRAQSLEWKASFYACVADLDRSSLLKAGLMSTPCVPTTAGTLVVPAQTSVFYPLSRGRKYGFEQELTIVDSELLEQAAAHSPRIHELFAALNVKRDEPFDLVNSHILPRHKGEAWKTSEKKALLGHLRYIKHELEQYLSGAKSAGKSEQEAIAAVRDGMWLGTKQQTDGKWMFSRASNLYVSKEYQPRFCIESLLGTAISGALLVSHEYLSIRARDAESEADSWGQFLSRIGVQEAPRIEKLPDGDAQGTVELRALMASPQSSVRKATLECLDHYWPLYSGSLAFSTRVGRSLINKETKLAVALRSMIAPTRKRASIPMSDAYYSSEELKELFGDAPVYVDAKLTRTDLLQACHLTFRADASACVKRLKQLKVEGGDTTPQLHAIYRRLERLWDKEAAFIKQAFAQEGLIRVKGLHAVWARPGEVAWRSNGAFLDSLYPPLQGQYRDFSAFFNNKLGIPRELPTAEMVAALPRLGEIESGEERSREAIAIYRRASRDLTPRAAKEEVPTPDWLDTFLSEEVFLNQRGELVANDARLFANDSPELGGLFADDPDVSLLVVPFEDLPRVRSLLHAADIQSLTASVEVSVIEAEGGQLREDLTAKIRSVVVFIGRAFYAKSHVKFESALKQGLFQRLREMEIVEVPDLQLEVTVANVSRRATWDIASTGNRILVKRGARSVKDQLAIEICKLLGAPEELADTISRLLLAEDAEAAEDFLRVRRISALPPDMEKALWGGEGEPSIEPASDGVPQEEIQTPDELEEVSARRGEHGVRGDAEAPAEGNRCTSTTAPSDQEAAVPAPAGHSPVLDERKSPIQVPPSSAVPGAMPNSASSSSQSQTKLSPGTNDDGTEGPGQAQWHRDAPISPRFEHSRGGPSGRRSRKRGGPLRTKSGRLMSYAASPAEAERASKEEDPARAAARDATAQAAVDYFMATQAARWKSLLPMPHNNPGFDIKAVSHDGQDEFIEVKGQSAAWTEDGVALTPTELAEAQRRGESYWLCVVEYTSDEKRRTLYLLKNPYGLTQQFRFDSGWKSAALSEAVVPLKPDAGLFVDLPGEGKGRIISVRRKGQFYKLHAILEGGRQVNKTFNPATMKLSTE